MRRILLAVLVVLGCSSPTAPASIAGTWSDQASAAASGSPYIVLTLRQTGTSITGTATSVNLPDTSYSVSGTYHAPHLALVSGTDSGPGLGLGEPDFIGTVVSPTVMELAINAGPTLRFVKQ